MKPKRSISSRYKSAVAIQQRLKRRLVLKDRLPRRIRYIGGVDVSYSRSTDSLWASIAIIDYKTLSPIEYVYARAKASFPYIPGLLAFREMPAILKAFRGIDIKPDILVFDGQGTAHPRGFGIACHAGVILGIPTIGCAKSRLCGSFRRPGIAKGSSSPLIDDNGKTIGHVVRTRQGVNPVFVSPGHMVSFRTAKKIVLRCSDRYRLPVPTRLAHIKSNEARVIIESDEARKYQE